jgi:hypothetical protein
MTDPTPADWQALCAELVDELEEWVAFGDVGEIELAHALIDRARVALAQPVPQGPTDEELTLVYAYAVAAAVGNKRGPFKTEEAEAAQLAGLRAVLARWGRPAIKPVPVSERLPGPEDCDDQGRCWMCGKVDGDWRLISIDNPGVPQLKYAFSHWLPHWVLPVPQQELDND